MEKVNKVIHITFLKLQEGLVGTIRTVSETVIVAFTASVDLLFAVGGEVTKNISILLGEINDHIARVKDLLDGEPK